MLGIHQYLWRLLPANPILLRVVETGGKKKRDLFIRCGYLGLLIIVVVFALATSGGQSSGSMSLSSLTNTSKQTFRYMSYLQLLLVSLLAQIFAAVAISSITMSFAIAAATAFVTGALAMAIATFKVGTRRTIFSFYLFVVIYLVGIYLLDTIPYFHVLGPKTSTGTSHISWFTGIHPFLALRVIIGDPRYRPPEPGMLPAALQGWPLSWYFTSP